MSDSAAIALSDAPLPHLVAFDLDDTLAPSKTALPAPMAQALRLLLDHMPVCIISGGQFAQFAQQVLAHLDASEAELAQLHLMPTCGTRYYTYAPSAARADATAAKATSAAGWRLVYANDLTPQQVQTASAIVEEQARRLGLWEPHAWGKIIENRGSQITFSALGQQAPLAAKRAWDPSGEKKIRLRDALAPLLPDLQVRCGGATSVDITLKGVDKAYGIRRLSAVTGIALADMLFVGDRLDPQGNDYPVKTLGVRCHAVENWQETAAFVNSLVCLADSKLTEH